MKTSLSSARDKKTDFHPRTGGNRYKVIKEQAAPDGKEDAGQIDIEKEVQATIGEGQVGEKKKSQAKTKSGFNTEFLLARALQTTVQDLS
jgi:hypothetical protein